MFSKKELNSISAVVEILGYFPITELYSFNKKYYIEEWYDIEDNIDKYFLYEIKLENLRLYLLGLISHMDLIKLGIKYYHLENDIYKKCQLTDIPSDSLPLPNSYFVNDYLEEEVLNDLNEFISKNI